ncbi:MAG: hypothetical protein K0S31_1465 [Sphingobacterium multivorum]|jgi:deoxycytidylate deaminase|nr:hypothetical protein [Sphingobacterium multivorum]
MSLKNLYSLRNNFLVVGLTGRTGGGANDICEFLQSETNPFALDKFTVPNNLHVNEIQKFTICQTLLTHQSNIWYKFSVIKYSDVLLLFFLKELFSEINVDDLNISVLTKLLSSVYDNKTAVTKRLGQDDTDDLALSILNYLNINESILKKLDQLFPLLSGNFNLKEYLLENNLDNFEKFRQFYYAEFSIFSKGLFRLIDKVDPVARQLFLQDIACNLRLGGNVLFEESTVNEAEPKHIFTVAIAINNLIKINRSSVRPNRIVIDSLKNSLEINYFRERYAGFYLIASSRDEIDANKYLNAKINRMGFTGDEAKKLFSMLKQVDQAHYQTKDFKIGKFTTPDVENCIQKADYYIYISQIHYSDTDKYSGHLYRYLKLEIQLLKFLALVQKPGIVTPSAIERSMQLAFSSKYNSGCISRQVGAVITDSNYSVKSVGWNEVPQGQTPCSLRSLQEIINEDRQNVYSEYEKSGGNYNGKSFKEKIKDTLKETYGNEKDFFNNLNGHNCPYCFKDFHNSFEGKENQVHTRSLHAEENAMLQISKYGGQPLNGGILFTTASPCELCSKKAFQLGIKKIFYIDPYPGIAKKQILTAGNNPINNPELFMFQGAVGRGYFKLYEPYMSIKDETYIRSGIRPKFSDEEKFLELRSLLLLNFPNSEEIRDISSYDSLILFMKKML